MGLEHLKTLRCWKSLILLWVVFIVLGASGCGPSLAEKQKRAKAYQDLASAKASEGNLRGALAELLKAIKLDPDDVELNHQLALVLRNLGQYDLSLKYFQRTLELDPKFSDARNNMGTLYLMMEKWDPAIACFKEALKDLVYNTPQYAYNNMGYAYYRKGDYDQAIRCYREAIRCAKPYAVAYANLGMAYAAKGDLDQAAAAYKEAIFYAPKDAAAHLGLSRVLMRQEKAEEAKEALNLVIWAAPMSDEAQEARELLKGMGSGK